uniref:Uncharacterized protein n=1 Tax=Candidatus Kentrum sp. UNK TaxID=2126344 RepID=A0A450ZYX6_9GAMM|nr:MAG: hypothetical protein BECKUNK1418G_GA0071005_100562 [Candidatus Kentron sp. UNK]VFK68651.1 MAG: hypothetical protein BECKUNK1418H_GA0071006_100462 [Candidatus Kentron sp. UNK]
MQKKPRPRRYAPPRAPTLLGGLGLLHLALIVSTAFAEPPGDAKAERPDHATEGEYAGFQVIGSPVEIIRDEWGALHAVPVEMPVITFTGGAEEGRQ